MPIFLRILHTCASVDAEITGAGHETMHQRCALGLLGKTWTSGVNGNDLDERDFGLNFNLVFTATSMTYVRLRSAIQF
jgi:hypothetical protein